MENHLDSEWTQLVKDAMSSGVSKEQFREFLEFTKWKQDQNNNRKKCLQTALLFLLKRGIPAFFIIFLRHLLDER